MAKSTKKLSAKLRADELVTTSGLSESRNKAQALIMAGEIEFRKRGESLWKRVEKSGQFFRPEEVEFRLLHEGPVDVGRGAQKLRYAFQQWSQWNQLNQQKKRIALDIGASTGGFTQVLLENGFQKVVALDVGTHQLHERLRSDVRVLSLEKQHILRTSDVDLKSFGVDLPFDAVVTDLSFISVTKIISHVAPWMAEGASWVILLKPQFELGPEKVPGGIVKDEKFHQEAILSLKNSVSMEKSLLWKDCTPSPILGGEGNKEFLVWLIKK